MITNNMKKRIPKPGVKAPGAVKATPPTTTTSIKKPSKTADAASTSVSPGIKAAPPKRALPKIAPPVAKPKVPIKEVKTDVEKETQKTIEGETGAGKEAPKPIVASGGESITAQPRPAHPGANEKPRGISNSEMRSMSFTAKLAMWTALNKTAREDQFIPLLKKSEVPKKMGMRLNEAILREIVEKKPSAKEALYCPYCVDWQPFRTHSWSGYRKCCGCSISTKDFYTAIDNNLIGKD